MVSAWATTSQIDSVLKSYDHIEHDADMAHIDALYHFTPERSLNPFFVALLGYVNINPDNRDHYGAMMVNFGLGFRYIFN